MRWRSIQLRYRYPGAAGAVSAAWLLPGPVVAQPQFRPPADVYETDGALVVRAELAGLPEGALDVQPLPGRPRRRRREALRASRRAALPRGRHPQRSLPPGSAAAASRRCSRVDARYDAGILVVVLPWSVPA